MKNQNIDSFEQTPEKPHDELKNLFGDNFTPEKTIKLKKDVDQDNQEKEITGQQVFWTELKDPETGEVVEGKIYLPENSKKIKQAVIFSPGYKGDSVLQEADYAADLVSKDRMMISLRHNGLKIDEGMENYVHCPEKIQAAEKSGQKYTGKGEDFNWEKANEEVLTALNSLSDVIDEIDKIDIIGHSWGAHIALRSVNKLKKQADGQDKQAELARKISGKIDNLVIMGAFLESRQEVLKEYLPFFKSEAGSDYYKNIAADRVVKDIIKSGHELARLKADDFPKDMRIVGMHSVGDKDIDLKDETMVFFKQMKDAKRKGSVIFKDLKELMPEKIGDRPAETHDYALAGVRKWVKQAID